MSEKTAFQYSILRYIPDYATGEFLNIGLAVYSKLDFYFRAQLLTKYSRITNTFPGVDGEFYRRYIIHLQLMLNKLSDKIQNSKSSYFADEWPDQIEQVLAMVLPIDDSTIRFGEPQGGLADNIDDVFDDMYGRLIERYLPEQERLTRDDEDIWNIYSKQFKEQNILWSLQPKVIRTPKDEIEFPHAWKNGKWNLLQPLSFDLKNATYIRRKARTWLGTNLILNDSNELNQVYYLLGKPRIENSGILKAYDDAKDILSAASVKYKLNLVEEDEAEDFAKNIKPQIISDIKHLDDE